MTAAYACCVCRARTRVVLFEEQGRTRAYCRECVDPAEEYLLDCDEVDVR